MTDIRPCRGDDLTEIVAILERKRALYMSASSRASGTASVASRSYLAGLIGKSEHVFLVATDTKRLVGFLLASPARVPPVYDAGPTALIDDFHVIDESLWLTVGADLLREGRRILRERGVSQIVVVSPFREDSKLEFLRQQGLSLTTAWLTNDT